MLRPMMLTVSLRQIRPLHGKFTFGKLYEKISFNKELISKGRFFEVNASHRSFSCEVKVEDAQRAIFDIAKVQEAAGFPNMSNFSGKEWCIISYMSLLGVGFVEAKVGVNKPELLPKEFTTVIDVAGFLLDGQEKRLAKEIDSIEKDTGRIQAPGSSSKLS
ncbi:hypothetical protein Tco_0320150 [Tanacetum coccineum]